MTEIKKEEQGLFDQGVIGPNSSPFGSSILIMMAHAITKDVA
jgi:hypothetical protein